MLPHETKAVWEMLRGEPLLAGSVLVGGTALALRLSHRLSEDLDFAYSSTKLPVEKLAALHRKITSRGLSMERNDNPAAYDEFLLAGMSLHDYQQDFLIKGRVKVTFFTEEAGSGVLGPGDSGQPRVAELTEIFALKALVSAARSKSRDWLDLYILMTEHNFSMSDFARAFARAGRQASLDIALGRLCSGKPDPDDPGFESLMEKPPSLADLTTYFIGQREEWERGTARDRMREKMG